MRTIFMLLSVLFFLALFNLNFAPYHFIHLSHFAPHSFTSFTAACTFHSSHIRRCQSQSHYMKNTTWYHYNFLLHLIIHSAAKRKHFNLTIHLFVVRTCRLCVQSTFAVIGDTYQRNPYHFQLQMRRSFCHCSFIHMSKIYLPFGVHAPTTLLRNHSSI